MKVISTLKNPLLPERKDHLMHLWGGGERAHKPRKALDESTPDKRPFNGEPLSLMAGEV